MNEREIAGVRYSKDGYKNPDVQWTNTATGDVGYFVKGSFVVVKASGSEGSDRARVESDDREFAAEGWIGEYTGGGDY